MVLLHRLLMVFVRPLLLIYPPTESLASICHDTIWILLCKGANCNQLQPDLLSFSQKEEGARLFDALCRFKRPLNWSGTKDLRSSSLCTNSPILCLSNVLLGVSVDIFRLIPMSITSQVLNTPEQRPIQRAVLCCLWMWRSWRDFLLKDMRSAIFYYQFWCTTLHDCSFLLVGIWWISIKVWTKPSWETPWML